MIMYGQLDASHDFDISKKLKVKLTIIYKMNFHQILIENCDATFIIQTM
jgi:hypothetical protein